MTRACPTELERALSSRGLRLGEVLVANERKASWTVRAITEDGTSRTVKWIAPWAPAFSREAFANEVNAYGSELIAPRTELIESGPNVMVLGWIDGVTARKRLLELLHDSQSVAFIPGMIGSIVRQVGEGMMRRTGEGPSRTSLADELRPVVFSLAASGPMDTHRSRIESAATRTMARIAQPLMSRRFHRLARFHPILEAQGVAHGDLHLDNILIDKDGRIHLIDFANVNVRGIPAVDLSYALTAALTLLDGVPQTQLATRSMVAQTLDGLVPGQSSGILGVVDELMLISRLNRRFNPYGPVRYRQLVFLWEAALPPQWRGAIA